MRALQQHGLLRGHVLLPQDLAPPHPLLDARPTLLALKALSLKALALNALSLNALSLKARSLDTLSLAALSLDAL